MKERYAIVSAVYLLTRNEHNQVLMGKRQNSGYYDEWYGVPAGHVDGNESLKSAMIREAKEELDIDIKEEDLTLVHTLHRAKTGDYERLDFFFTCDTWEGEPRIAEPDKCTELTWIDPTDESVDIMPHVRRVIARVETGENYSDEDFELI